MIHGYWSDGDILCNLEACMAPDLYLAYDLDYSVHTVCGGAWDTLLD